MAVEGRTNEVASLCERFDREFNIWYEGCAITNFQNLAYETYYLFQSGAIDPSLKKDDGRTNRQDSTRSGGKQDGIR
jgi:hypothetical protein